MAVIRQVQLVARQLIAFGRLKLDDREDLVRHLIGRKTTNRLRAIETNVLRKLSYYLDVARQLIAFGRLKRAGGGPRHDAGCLVARQLIAFGRLKPQGLLPAAVVVLVSQDN